VGASQESRTVGHLYRGIEAGLAHLCRFYGEEAVFIGPPQAQAVTEIFEWPELIAVTDLASARRAIEVIVEQGEGARGDWTKSHFGTFVGILEDLLAPQPAERLDVLEQACGSLAREAGLGMLGQLAERLHSISAEVRDRLAAQRE
jgi:hypothetical protein